MSNLFEKLIHCERDILIANANSVIVKLEVNKCDNGYHIDCVAINPVEFIKIPVLLFKIQSRQSNGLFLSVDQLENLLFTCMDSIYKCQRCGSVYKDNSNEKEKENVCNICKLEIKYIESRKGKCMTCSLCDSVHWKWASKKVTCCRRDDLRVCFACANRIETIGFCPYCREAIELV